MSLRGAIYGTTILTRSEIGLVPPRSTTRISAPEMVTAHYAGPTDWRQSGIDRSSPARFRDTTDHARCAAIMRAHQAFHMGPSRGWVDYAYSGAACPHGVGFIGRGRGVRTAAQGTTDGNNRSYAIQYMGAGPDDPLTDEAKRAFIDFADYLGKPLRRGHRDWKPTSCPGDLVYAWRLSGFPKVAGGPIPKPPTSEDELTPEESDYLRRIAHAVIPFYQQQLADAGKSDGRFQVQPLVRGVLKEDAFKDLLAKTVHKAVADVFAFAAGAKEGPIHDVIRQALGDKPAPPS